MRKLPFPLIVVVIFILGLVVHINSTSTTRSNRLNTTISPTEKLQEYTACGCGCCGGSLNKRKTICLDEEHGETLEEIIAQDRETAQDEELCAVVGCSIGTTYKYCE